MPTALGVSKAIFFKEMRRKSKYLLQNAVVSFTGIQVTQMRPCGPVASLYDAIHVESVRHDT